ncbi:MAG: hypothetical protein ACH254_21020 [Candidatus Thiodiazotropha endolucinida]
MDGSDQKEKSLLEEQYIELMQGHAIENHKDQSLEQPYPVVFVDSVTTNYTLNYKE